MITRQRSKVLIGGAVLAAGTAIIGGAFTAGGVTDGSDDQFIGGTATVIVTGASMTNVNYDIVAGGIDKITITFTSTGVIAGRAVTVELYNSVPTLLDLYTCTAIGAVTTNVSTCTATSTRATPSAVNTVDFTVEN